MTAAPSAKDRAWHGSPAGRAAGPARAPARPWFEWTLLLPTMVTLGAALWGIGGASFWRDEAATLSATRRSLPELLRMLGHTDAVHGLYYLLMWPAVRALGTSELALRLPSAIAVTAAALCTTAIGRRLSSRRTGLFAGLVFALLPSVSSYGQEARSYALVAALATLASYLLIRVMDEPRRRWLVAYGLSLTALGLANVFGLLLVPAHAVTVAGSRGRRPGHADHDGGRPRVTRRWLITVAAACLATLPVAVITWAERSQLSWLRRPQWSDLYGLLTGWAGAVPAMVIIAVLAALGLIEPLAGRLRRTGSHDRRLIWMGAPWLVLPTAILFAASAITPVYLSRYVLFCLPALALLAGAGLAAVSRAGSRPAAGPGPAVSRTASRRAVSRAAPVLAAAALIAIGVVTFPAQRAAREPGGHGDSIRAVAQYLRAHERPGDVIAYDDPGTRVDSTAYAYGFTRLRDISLRESPAATGTLGGTQAPPSLFLPRLAGTTRVWLIQVGQAQSAVVAAIRGPRFRLLGTWWFSSIEVSLYQRTPQPQG